MNKKDSGLKLKAKSEILKGISHPVRNAIVEMLGEQEVCSCDIAGRFAVDRTTVSKHLALMTKLGILSVTRDSQNLFYSLKMTCLLSVLKCIDGVIETGICDCGGD